ncbi:amino acid ABC transporter substrate-binding protein [Paracoccus suum]|uniref:Amino acid ABC transporter substrate-binding protein n=1 Tax=Paracoccus suum TaxID=2259340 RepID=A0A344PN03_9RHOB|nr:transporter substrate-binding domain-containing protein [Paracoccus suum]AXC50758.1 amino acid ABC transporter substrate-binding protein [Paracoccus suum]
MNRRQLFRVAVTAMALSGLGAFAHADTVANLKSAGKMRVAVLQDYPPFGSVGPDMKPLGLDVDLANMIAEKLGVTAEFVPVSAPNRIPYLQTGKVDVIIASLGKNAEREKVVEYSKPYAMTFNGVFGPPDVKVSGPEDLSGKSLAVTRGSTQDLIISDLVPKDAELKRFEDSTGTQAAYMSGQADLFVTGNITAFMVAKDAKRPLETKFKLNDEGAYVGAVKGDTAFISAINEAIDALKADGKLNELSEKWLGEPAPANL